jgi:hypothetical protein
MKRSPLSQTLKNRYLPYQANSSSLLFWALVLARRLQFICDALYLFVVSQVVKEKIEVMNSQATASADARALVKCHKTTYHRC